ncbi:hypothetical protein HYS48_00070 [Candidatus Woesearchaeota archaeon]|nr:hypothetical protein [Candidatus Woesearchaeota archaeon]
MTLDIDIGFAREPTGLAAFLRQEGYTRVERQDKGCTVYTQPEDSWPQVLHFHPTIKAAEGEVPNWERSGHTIVSAVNINFPTDSAAMDEAERLSKKIVQALGGILYDSNLDEYFTREEL